MFVYSRVGPLLQPFGNAAVICVNLVKVWEWVEELVRRVRAEHNDGNVSIVGGVEPRAGMNMRFGELG